MDQKTIHTTFNFLQGGGKTGELIRNFDWAATSIGASDAWPIELKNAVRLMLDSPIAICIMWSKDYLQIYNDAFIPSFGQTRHPSAMGKPVKESSQRWPVVEELFKRIWNGESIYHEDSKLLVDKNGFKEECYFNISYVPIYVQDGTVGGVQCIALETTDKVNALKEIKDSAAKFRALVEEAPVGTCLFTGRDMKVEIINDIMVGYWGKGHTVLGKPLVEALPELVDQSFLQLLDEVYTTGKIYTAKGALVELEVDGIKKDYYYDFTYKPVRNSSGEIFGIINVSIDATERVLAQKKLENSQEQLLSYFEQSPVAIATIGKEDLTFKLVNPFYAELVGRTPEQIQNKPLLEALPELKGQGFDDLLLGVIESGDPYIANEVAVNIKRNGKLETIYVNLTYAPQRGSNNEVIGILVVATDVTQQVNSRKKVEESEERFRFALDEAKKQKRLNDSITNNTPDLVYVFSTSYIFAYANKALLSMWGKTAEEAIGKGLRENGYEEWHAQMHEREIDEIVATKKSIRGTVSFPHAELGSRVYDYILVPVLNEKGEVEAVAGTTRDITDIKYVEGKLQQSEAHLQLLRDTVPAMIFYLDNEQRYQSYNVVFMDWFKVNAIDAIGKTVREFIGEEAYAKTHPNLVKAYAGEQVHYEMYAPSRMNGDKWLSIVYTPHKNSEGEIKGLIVHATDITEHVLNRIKIEESELFTKDIIHNSPVAKIVYTGEDLTITIVNKNMLQILGRDDSILGKPFVEAIPELAGSSLEKKMKEVLATGEMYVQAEEKIELLRFGKPYVGYYSYTYKALRKVSGEIYGMMATATEITDQVVARQKIEAKEKELRDLIIAAPIGICVVSGDPLWVEEVNNRFLLISGKTREQYANAPYWEVLEEVAHIFKPVLENVFRSGIKYTTEENEMMLIRDGVAENIFLTFEYIPVIDANNIVTKVIVMAVEVTHQVETRKQIEAAVIERTKELDESNLSLKRSNAELEQFAYIASHDLQEPIRKISTFAQMLENSIVDINEQSKNYLSKIYGSTDRMTKLIRDVLAFSQISAKADGFEKTDLSKTIQNIRTDFELLIEQKQAKIEVENMPVVMAIPSQMTQLFSNLFSNSLKYTKTGVSPVIKISSSIAKKEKVEGHPNIDPKKKYYHIQFSDNGIGFDQEHADRIFKIFQRLHAKTEFEGTGIGLSICRKIVQAHEGHIAAAVGANGGAVFNILLPVSN